MKKIFILVFSCALTSFTFSQSGGSRQGNILTRNDFDYLETLTRTIIDSSRIFPDQSVVKNFGPNNTGGVLIKPGGRRSYPSFWIRDYAMSVETGFITPEEQKHMLLITASTQSDQTTITKNGSIIPFGAIADHIRIDDGLPIYFPGTYDYIEQGNKIFGIYPPYCDQFFFIHMAYYYVKTTSDAAILNHEINDIRLIDRLETAFNVPPSRLDNQIVYTTDAFRGIDFGFRDVITITGALCFPSILKIRASDELSELFEILNEKSKSDKYKSIADKIKKSIPDVFQDNRGLLHASTGKGNQPDVWATALAVYLNILDAKNSEKASMILSEAYKEGTLAYHGNIRHILTSDDFNDSTAWEISLAKKNTYQNGAYWGTPTGWVCYAIAKTDFQLAQKLAKEYIDDLRENDFRKGNGYGAPYECFHPSGYHQNPLYMATVSCPYIAFLIF
jgi:hypothetical protein